MGGSSPVRPGVAKELENANKELKSLLEQTRDDARRKAAELEAHRSQIATLTVENNALRAGEKSESFMWDQQGETNESDAGGLNSRGVPHHLRLRKGEKFGRGNTVSMSLAGGKLGGASTADSQNRTPSRIAKQLNLQRRGRKRDMDAARRGHAAASGAGAADEGGAPSRPTVMHLPRGGVYVWTKAGPLQFGIPPETVKDSMNLGLDVPTVFVVPRERFNLQMGINVSEIEFPAFFNFFVRRRQMTLVTYQDCAEDLFTIMKEALDGPDADQLYIGEEYSRFASKSVLEAKPDHIKEMDYFREPRPGTPTIKVANLVRFAFFNAMGECHLENDVVIKDESYGYTVLQDDAVIAAISDDEAKSCFFPGPGNTACPLKSAPTAAAAVDGGDKPSGGPVATTGTEHADDDGVEDLNKNMFQIPRFGLTILGNSHGFDPTGSTSGFVIWINGQGIMVDPPPHSGEFLKRSGIQPKLITATILTHCHADHDAGTIQKMITEDKITLMTTKTVFYSLLRKYAGVAGLAPAFLRQLVSFRPVFMEEPTYWGGACFRFFYSLHAIPCVGFEVSFEGKRVVYSADTFFEPEGLKALHERGILSTGRLNALLNFPWTCDVVLHEAGVPPIHTPLSAFEKLPPEHRKNIQLIHIGTKDQRDAEKRGFTVSKPGIAHTIVLSASSDTQQETLRFFQLIASVDIFKGFPITQALELLLMSSQVVYEPGQVIAEKGSPGDKFMVIMSGQASVSFGMTKKYFKVGDYLGEISVITGEDRTATIIAETQCTIVEVDKYAFHYFLVKDKQLYAKMENLVKSRMDGSWHAIARNSVLRNLSAAQKTSLQAFLHIKNYKKNEVVWRRGDTAIGAALILSGNFVFDEVHRADPFELLTATRHPHQRNYDDDDNQVVPFEPLSTGVFICDMYGMSTNSELTVTLICDSDEGVLFYISQENVLGFLDANPMMMLALLRSLLIV